MRNSRIEVKPIAGVCGAEIYGAAIADDLDDGVIADIRQALLDHGVVFFRGQEFDAAQHKAFARRFGEIFVHPNYRGMQDDDEIVMIRREPGDRHIVGEDWHADTTMMEAPPMGAILVALEVPPYGGDTLFANQYLAYDTLSDGLKTMLAGLRAVHTDRKVAGPAANRNAYRAAKVRQGDDWRETINLHPVVRTHPETGRKLLNVNMAYTVAFEGMTEEEPKPLLDYLMAHGNRPEFTCRFRWEKGSVAFWDNRAVKHLAINDAGPYLRVMRRVQLAGDKPYA
jgi:alpha-ketoglutarate-dependent taurine dioxygenase